MAIVELKPVTRHTTWGLPDPKNPEKFMHKYPRSRDKWCVGMNLRTGIMNTGLTKEREEYYEDAMSMPRGTLSVNSDYWITYFLLIDRDGIRLDDSKIEDELAIELLRNDPTVAKSPEEANIIANAEYYLTSKENDAKVRNQKREVRLKASALYNKMTESQVIDTLYMFGKNPSDTSMEVLKDELGTIVEEQPGLFIQVFGDKNFGDKVFVMKCVREGVIRKASLKTGFDVPLYFEDILLGANIDEAVAFLKDKENAGVKSGIEQSYKNKIKT